MLSFLSINSINQMVLVHMPMSKISMKTHQMKGLSGKGMFLVDEGIVGKDKLSVNGNGLGFPSKKSLAILSSKAEDLQVKPKVQNIKFNL
jgi:polysaccharide deacetylase 2 family uncharacterized protein YibQ